MPGTYDEENNKTAYPLNGGAKQPHPRDLQHEYEVVLSDANNLRHQIELKDKEIELITKQNKEFLKLLTLAIGGYKAVNDNNSGCNKPDEAEIDVISGLMGKNS